MGPTGRIPLRNIILAKTGQDVRLCRSCDTCKQLPAYGSDMTVGEIIRAASRDDATAIASQAIWCLEPEDLSDFPCQAGLDLAQILPVLWQEASRRGLNPAEAGSR